MKISKSLLLAIAAAVTIATVSCTKEKPDPKDESKTEKKIPAQDSCPACGMG